MRRSGHEFDRSVAQRFIGLVVGKYELVHGFEPFLLEEAELDRRDCRKI